MPAKGVVAATKPGLGSDLTCAAVKKRSYQVCQVRPTRILGYVNAAVICQAQRVLC